MEIELHPSFEKAFKKRVAWNQKLTAKTEERIAIFLKNPYHPILENHKLQEKKLQLRAFSITGDIRIVYFPVDENRSLFLDIGTHNQVY